ncbi:methylmalonyl-CoA mutase family protein [Pseudonocardia sp. Cha107L01]|uniref:methylmalonyl-CoA mutase family protein n=1 Tax=Pseudonocardia sp. Cha107L01 TaxID=3457576 RepID=UPI0028C7D4D3|nr:2-hydroxyisobutanoyl-CoA mutase large subunit [Pseudonocardiales bacterium]MDT7673520.1 2-hydroxyisobutanoyl-CoA mutase large subunit [Pseudonocardiales bacterium]MDT7681197.1 2-hydroxyisobutanoyl-CoA mutase large subunit [Pseudonocardiales bacterium]
MTTNRELASEALVKAVTEELADWESDELAAFTRRAPESRDDYRTGSGAPVQRVYTPADLPADWDEIGLPGRYPYTRGPYPTMYRGRTWTMRQIAGFGQAEETNGRFRYLIAQGQTGLSVDFDMPTLMGLDSDDEMSLGEVGREGVAIDTLPDMDALFDGIDLEQISVSMTINPSAWILLAMYVAVAEERGLDLDKLSGTIQNDILKEYVAQKEWIFPIRPSMRIVRDTVTYCAGRMARYNPVNISGYHISEAGANALQEIAFTMAITRAYVDDVVATGVDVDAFAPRLSFFFVSQADLFEEVAKFRAVRRYYAKMMKQRYGAKNPQSMRLRFHAQTAAATLTKPQPLNNIVRTALQALSAVLGGAQSLHTNGLDEAYTIPSEQAMKVALRTQQIIADETNVPNVIDPLGGSYYVEKLTSELEHGIERYFEKIDELGGVVAAIEQGFFQREISDTAYDFARRKASGDRPVIGVNKNVDTEPDAKIETHQLDPESEDRQIRRLKQVRSDRDPRRAEAALTALVEVARDDSANLMAATIEAVKAHLSMGEITGALRDVFGTYTETPVF